MTEAGDQAIAQNLSDLKLAQRCGGDYGDLAQPQTRPVEPDRQVGKVGPGDEEEGREQGGDAGGKSEALAPGIVRAHAAVRQLGAAPG